MSKRVEHSMKLNIIIFCLILANGAWSKPMCKKTSLPHLKNHQQFHKQLNMPKQKVAGKHFPVTIAIIDTGLDIHHSAFENKLWVNAGETGLDSRGKQKQNNFIDDDKNGYIDDIHGWDFTENQNKFPDRIGHGTHVTGLVVAEDRCSEFRGLAPKSKIMVLKYYDHGQSGKDTLSKSVLAMQYAIKMGAKIINYSGGGNIASDKELEVLREAEKRGIIVVAAAGNEKQHADKSPYYPASYKLNNILSVAAVSKNFDLAGFSNYGRQNVHIAAPGVNVVSTLPGNKYGSLSGTSQATAFVTGAIAILLEKEMDLTPPQIISRLQASRRYLASLEVKTQFQGLVDIGNAVKVKDTQGSLYGGRVAHTGVMKNWFLINNENSVLFLE